MIEGWIHFTSSTKDFISLLFCFHSDYESQIKELKEKLSQNEDERSLLRERLNEVELELRKTFDDHSSVLNKYEEQLQSAVQERNALVEQQAIQSTET